MAKKTKKPTDAELPEGAVAEVPDEGAEPEFDTSDVDAVDGAPPEATEDEEVAGTASETLHVPAADSRVRYAEIRDDMLIDVVARVLHVDGETLTLALPATASTPARVVVAARYDQATRAGWWV